MSNPNTISIWNATVKQLRPFAVKQPRWEEFCEKNKVNAASVKLYQLKVFLSEWCGIEEITIQDGEPNPTPGEGEGKDTPRRKGKSPDGEGEVEAGGDGDSGDAGKGDAEKDAGEKRVTRIEEIFNERVNEEVARILEERGGGNSEITIHVKREDGPDNELTGVMHFMMPLLLSAAIHNVPLLMYGEAGCGKTHACEQVAQAINVPFYVSGAVASEFKLTGFKDAYGNYQSTQYRQAFESESLFTWDEFDRSVPAALMCVNSGVANGWQDFPDGMVKRHEGNRLIATANTTGKGANLQYTTANAIDAATRDRFVTLEWCFDIGVECALAGVKRPDSAPEPVKLVEDRDMDAWRPYWANRVFKQRQAYADQRIKEVVSTRAILNGNKLAEAGWPEEYIAEGVLWKGLSESNRAKVESAVKRLPDVVTA